MPVFNTGRYLDDSIGSVLQQNYCDFELVIIDDASSDEKTESKLEEYKNKDSRIRLYRSEEHIGPAKARNWGINLSRGDYIMFLDSDDYFEKELLVSCLGQSERYEADIVVFNYAHSDSEHLHDIIYANRSKEFYKKYAKSCFSFEDYENSEVFLYAFANGTKFFRSELISKNRILFQDIKRQNDIFFSLVSMLYADRVIFIEDDKVLLHARDHDLNERVSNTPMPFCGYLAVCDVMERVKSDNKLCLFSKILSIAAVRLVFNGLFQCISSDIEGAAFYSYMRNDGINHFDNLLDATQNDISVFYKGLRNAFALEYDSKWWLKNDYMHVLNICANSGAKDIIKNNNKKRFVFWGVGPRGAFILGVLKRIGIVIQMVVDSSPDLRGKCIEGNVVFLPEEAKKCCDLVITGNSIVKDYVETELYWRDKQCVLIELFDDMVK